MFIVRLGVTAIGEDLRESLLVVYLNEAAVLGQRLLLLVEAIDELRGVVMIDLVVHHSLKRQTLRKVWSLVGPTERDGGHRHYEWRELKDVDDGLRAIDGGAEEAAAKAFLLSQIAERLAVKQGVRGSIHEGEEIRESRIGVTAFRPLGGAAGVGAERQHHGSLRHHRLAEMCGSQTALHLVIARHYHAVKLEIAHCLRALSLSKKAVEQLVFHLTGGIFTYCTSCVYGLHFSCYFVFHKGSAFNGNKRKEAYAFSQNIYEMILIYGIIIVVLQTLRSRENTSTYI